MGGKVGSAKTAHFRSRGFGGGGDSKAPRHRSSKVFLFSFLLNVKSHVSRSPAISGYRPMYKIGIILSSHPFSNATNITFVYIYSQTERTVDGGRYLFIKR